VKKEYNAMTGHKDDVYEFDLKTEETGEFICTVEIDQAGLEIIIQKGFVAILTEYLEKHEKEKLTIPENMTEEEAIKFWEKADLVDYIHDTEEEDIELSQELKEEIIDRK